MEIIKNMLTVCFLTKKKATGENCVSLCGLKIGEISQGHFCMDTSICSQFLINLPLFVRMVMYDELKNKKIIINYNEVKFEPETK